MPIEAVKFVPWIPLLGSVLCCLCCCRKSWAGFAGPICVLSVFTAFALSLLTFGSLPEAGHATVTFFPWIEAGHFTADIGYHLDTLTHLMLFVVTGIGTLIAWYATGYMKGDRGYARFFAGVSVFIFAMTNLVMADNLVLLYLGWEGVGLASYLLIGFYYKKPSAVAAAKKAFIVNRIGDFGFALGIFTLFATFGVVSYDALFAGVGDAGLIASFEGDWKERAVIAAPFLLMLGAFGKSAQLPLHVWLPDAMEGPTPVSALIHAATMVTAGVYMVARLMPVFELSPAALQTIAIVGGITALFAATIALCQFDIKRIWAYSTVSQLGYMFVGVGVMGTTGGVFHLFTHAFFKALLFLTAGSVMHALAGQLDLRKMSGLRRKMPVTCWLMFAGCLALAGVPGTAGFFSKDQILYDALNTQGLAWVGWLGVVTALLTAFYTFRLWFRVFMGPEHYVLEDEHHGYSPTHHAYVFEPGENPKETGEDQHHHHEPHEMPWRMNAPLVVLAVGAIAGGFVFDGWMTDSISASSAAVGHPEHHLAKGDPGYISHATVGLITGGGAVVMIALAAWLFWLNRGAAQGLAKLATPLRVLWERKYFIDEIYHWLIVKPLRGLSYLCYFVGDKTLLDGALYDGLFQHAPRVAADAQAATSRGRLQGYATLMGVGLLLVLAVVLYVLVLNPS